MEQKKAVGIELRALMNLMKRQVHHQKSCEEPEKMQDYTPMHTWTIGYLFEHQDKDIFQKDFECEFNVRRSTASKFLSAMENSGLIERKTVHYDTRLKKIVLTDKALQLHDIFSRRICQFEQQIIKDIPGEKLEVFYEVIDMMKKNLNTL